MRTNEKLHPVEPKHETPGACRPQPGSATREQDVEAETARDARFVGVGLAHVFGANHVLHGQHARFVQPGPPRNAHTHTQTHIHTSPSGRTVHAAEPMTRYQRSNIHKASERREET